MRLVSEVPLGAFLSGGVDSSAVVAMMAGLQDDPVNTCAIGFDVAQFNETEYAATVAERYHTKHFQQTVGSDDFGLLDELAALYDEPYADSSAIPTYRVCQLARQRVTVALSGDGGDEHFAGYRRYRMHLQEERLRQALPLGLRRPLFGALGRSTPRRTGRRGYSAPKPPSRRWRAIRCRPTCTPCPSAVPSSAPRCSASASSASCRVTQWTACSMRMPQRAPTDDPLSLIQYLDMKTYLVGRYPDQGGPRQHGAFAGGAGAIARPSAHRVGLGLPADIKLRGSEGKYLLKKSLEPHLPQDVLYRRKMGFGVPLAKWFRGPLKARLKRDLLEGGLVATGMFNPQYLARLVDEHLRGKARPQRAPVDPAHVPGHPARRPVRARRISGQPCAYCTYSTTPFPLHSGYTFPYPQHPARAARPGLAHRPGDRPQAGPQ